MAAKQVLWGLATGSDPLLSLIREGVYSTSTPVAHTLPLGLTSARSRQEKHVCPVP
jgi:hypothetical protein